MIHLAEAISQLERKLHRAQARARANRLYYAWCKKNQPCALCRRVASDHAFHHISPTLKLFSIYQGFYRSRRQLNREIYKCALLCRQCHHKIHIDLRSGDTSAYNLKPHYSPRHKGRDAAPARRRRKRK